MNAALLTPADVPQERDRILELIGAEVGPEGNACVLISGGLDSDVVARLAVRALSAQRVKLVTIVQDEMDPAHRAHAKALADAVGVGLVEVDFRGLNVDVVSRLAVGDPTEVFMPEGLLDPARMKCSLRTVVASSYQDRGYIILGTSNRTEAQLGFFLPFGDGMWHVGPIAHLYKSEVRHLARDLNTDDAVLAQAPSAGFWTDQTDREDLGFWLVNRGPIQREREFTDAEVSHAASLSEELEEERVDHALMRLTGGGVDGIPDGTLGADLMQRLADIVAKSARLKTRPTGVTLDRRD
jgi:NAD+ synthase